MVGALTMASVCGAATLNFSVIVDASRCCLSRIDSNRSTRHYS
jgi:hypothetical protein